jgi:uncharacterized protein (TIGR00369 family)
LAGRKARKTGTSIMPVMTIDMLHDFLEREFPQISHLGMRVEDLEENWLKVRMVTDERHVRPGGTVSGPTLMSLCDASMYLVILSQIGPVALAVTTNLNINFLNKPEPGDIIADVKLLKLGKRLAVGEVTIYSSGKSDPVAHATLTYSIPPNRGV